MSGGTRRRVGLALILVTACPRPRPPAPDAGPPPDAGPLDAGAVKLPDLKLTLYELFPDGGLAELPQEGRPVLTLGQGLQLSASPALTNYRVRVFDEGDRVVPSDDHAEPAGWQIRFLHPLDPGRRWTLVVDASTGSTFQDAYGRAHPDVRVQFVSPGERPRPEKKSKSKKRRR